MVVQGGISAPNAALPHHGVPGPTTRAGFYHRPRLATAGSGGNNREQAPRRLADPSPTPADRERRQQTASGSNG
ncbi:hypothetical protein Acsp02_75400 [Actinoplanes sp. NBRC 103695]|nr:hypothetical protein Acsp02_75400 [Actinoplanes sp. NBRC 103695]